MRANGIPQRVTDKTRRSVVWRQGRRQPDVYGEWGGERELRALAIYKQINITVRDVCNERADVPVKIYLHNGNEYSAIPIAHSIKQKEEYTGCPRFVDMVLFANISRTI